MIYPSSHYGRDALVGIGLFLTMMAERKQSCHEIKQSLPQYHIAKSKVSLDDIDPDAVLDEMKMRYQTYPIDTIDGVKVHLKHEWVHMRKSNTEPIIRIYAESVDQTSAEALAAKFVEEIRSL